MRRLIALGILLCTLSSVRVKSPAELLSRDRMVSILVDLEISRAMAQYYANDGDIARRLAKENADLVYKTHNISPETLKKSYQYYLSHLDIMQDIYEEVIKQLEELQARIE